MIGQLPWAALPDLYESLELTSKATPDEIKRAYQRHVGELKASRVADATEGLAEVEAAYAVLRDPAKRAAYDQQFHEAEAKQEFKYAELTALLKRNGYHARKREKENATGILDAIWAFFDIFK